MSTLARYHPREIDIDLAKSLSPALYEEIISLHGQIARPPAAPVFTCLGNGQPMYVYRRNGRYFLRHYPNGAGDCSGHELTTMSDEHRRQADYTHRAAADHGLDVTVELATGNGTRLDVAVTGPNHRVGFEVQRSELSRAAAKTRATKSFNAGWPTAWVTDREKDPDWADHVPTARLTTRSTWSYELPPRNTQRVIIGRFTRERDRYAPSGWRPNRTWRPNREPTAVLLDELAYLMPAGEIIPVATGANGVVSLAFKDAAEIIDACTYDGASVWLPSNVTPRSKEAPQWFSRGCEAHPADSAPPDSTDNATPEPAASATSGSADSPRCSGCKKPLWASVSIQRGYCERCRLDALAR